MSASHLILAERGAQVALLGEVADERADTGEAFGLGHRRDLRDLRIRLG
jgi:hypothetical protein